MSNELAAVVFFLALLAALIARIAAALKQSPYTPFQSVFFFANVLLTRLWWRAKVPRKLPIASDQGALIVCNHRSSVDPFFVQLAVGRVAHWLVDRAPFHHWSTGWFLRLTEAIPVRRGGIDTAATKSAIRMASEGELIGLFPEGRINESNKFMLSVRAGAALIALKARVPIVPCYITGPYYSKSIWSPFTRRANAVVKFGNVLDLSDFYDLDHDNGVLREIMRRWAKEIGRLAGLPDYEPEFAGREWRDDK